MAANYIPLFQKIIWDYYRDHKRQFPWRETHDPYHILVSEIMLQQTQVTRVIEKYPRFLTAFPTLHALADASLQEILRVWSGLGYNRRTLYLKQAATIFVTLYNSTIPNNQHVLTKLPGIGNATAGAVVAYAYNQPVAFIETNIRRTFIYHFFKKQADIHDKEILPFIEQTLNRTNPREWYWALTDYGANLAKLAKNPNTRSAHYTKQSKFEGSVRQLRGRIVRELIASTPQPLAIPMLQTIHAHNAAHFQEALHGLKRDGLIKTVGKQVYFVQKA